MSKVEGNALLSEIAGQLRKLADNLALYAGTAEAEEPTSVYAPESTSAAPFLTISDVRSVLGGKVTAEAKMLLSRFGVKKLSEVDPADYGRLMKEAEDLPDAT